MQRRLKVHLLVIVEEMIEVTIFKSSNDSISLKLIDFLVNFAKCKYCGYKFNKDLFLCECPKKPKKNLGTYVVDNKKLRELSLLQRKSDATLRSKERNKYRYEIIKEAGNRYNKRELNFIYNLQNGNCYYCEINLGEFGKKGAYEKEHLKPISKCGDSRPENIALVCKNCNQEKGNLGERAYWNLLEKKFGKRIITKRKDSAKIQKEKKRSLRI